MAVNNDQFQVTPYTSTVPLVQVPPQAVEQQSRPAAPLQGEFNRKSTGALAIGDSLLKGFMQGHQVKEQRKNAQAQATINAADAASNAAYEQYQSALTKAGGNQKDPAAQAAYQSYVQAFQAGKQAKAKYVMPEKTQKGKKSSGDSDPVRSPDDKKKKSPVSAGFNNIKDFFEANPHIVPQIALLTMQPKPPGLSPDGQQQSQSLESQKLSVQQQQASVAEMQRKQGAEKIYDQYSGLNEQEFAALPPDQQRQFNSAKNILFPPRATGATYLYETPDGKITRTYPGQEPAGSVPYVAGRDVKPGTPGFYLAQKAKELQKGVNDLSTEEIDAAMGEYRASQTPTTSTTSTSTINPEGDRTTTTRRTASPGGTQRPPVASPRGSTTPSGFTPPPTAKTGSSGKTAQGMSAPPQVARTTKTGITPPPRGKQTALTASVTRQAVKEQQEGYQKAERAYSKALEDADKAFAAAQKTATTTGDPSILATAQAAKDRAVARARLDLEDAKASVASEYDESVRSIGGTPGGQSGSSQNQQVRYYQGYPYVQDPQTGQWILQQGQ